MSICTTCSKKIGQTTYFLKVSGANTTRRRAKFWQKRESYCEIFRFIGKVRTTRFHPEHLIFRPN